MERQFEEILPDVWKPQEAGDEIEGFLIKIEESKTFDNKIYLLETKEGHRVIFGTTVLENRMTYVNVGDYVKIMYEGLEKNKKNQDTKIFRVFKEIPRAK